MGDTRFKPEDILRDTDISEELFLDDDRTYVFELWHGTTHFFNSFDAPEDT